MVARDLSNTDSSFIIEGREGQIYQETDKWLGGGGQSIVYYGNTLSRGSTYSSLDSNPLIETENMAIAVARTDRVEAAQAIQSTGLLCRKIPDNPSIVKPHVATVSEKETFAVTNLYDGDIVKFLETKAQDLNREQRKYLIGSLINAFYAVHKAGIVHRDVKPDNILFIQDKDPNKNPADRDFFKFGLTDFGLAVPINDPKIKCFGGTFAYLAPEVVLQCSVGRADNQTVAQKYTKPAIDIWVLGIICFNIWMGGDQLPFMKEVLEAEKQHAGNGFVILRRNVISCHGQLKLNQSPIDDQINAAFLRKNSSGVSEAQKDEDLKMQELITGMLQVDPRKRISTQKLKQKATQIDGIF